MVGRLSFEQLLAAADEIVAGDERADVRLKRICRLLAGVPHYNWVGFYVAENARRELVLGPYVGAPTDHIRIPFGRGICGQAAEREETFVVQDVSKESNYLSCSLHVKSEIVVPVFHDGRIVGEIDIDSHELEPFGPEDRRFLEQLAVRVAPLVAHG